MRANRARQLLELSELFQAHRRKPLHEAIERIAGTGAGSAELRERLYVMLFRLPVQVDEQGRRLLGEQYASYEQEVGQVVEHFRAQSLNKTWGDLSSVLNRSVVIAITAVADLVDLRLSLGPVDESKRSVIEESIRALIDEIKQDEELDESIRNYLLGVALHLLHAVQNFVVFGADAVVDLQGRFVTDAIYEHPELVDERSRAKRYATKLWTIFIGAATLVGVGPDAAALVTLVRELTDGSD